MTEEEYFRKNYPDSCYGDRPLSPYWDFFQDGVEFGERQFEKKIEELEKRIAEASEIINDILEYFRNKTISYPYCMLEVLAKAQQFIDDNTPWEIIKGVSND